MYNWSTDEKVFKKDKEKYDIWRLEQLINFGLGGEKIQKQELKMHLPKLKLDTFRRKFIELILNVK